MTVEFEPDRALHTIGERALLRYLRERIPPSDGVLVGVGDDAAVVETAVATIVTTDALVEGIHFRPEWSPARLIGRKSMSVNFSDVAAMGGVTRFAAINLCLPPTLTFGFLSQLYDGFLERARECGVGVVGGNLAATPGPLTIDVVALGVAGRVVRRDGARAGDRVVVTGTLGWAAAGIQLLERGRRWGDPHSARDPETRCLRAQIDPDPPLEVGSALAPDPMLHAMMDISDGFAGDLLTMCEMSGCGAEIETVPIDPEFASACQRRGADGRQLALHGGEDYELLMAVSPEGIAAATERAGRCGRRMQVVGRFVSGPPEVKLQEEGRLQPLEAKGFDHFGRRGRRQ